jgi:signal transduction histidine kinase
MDIKLVSQDVELYKLCHEILAGIPGRRWTFSMLSQEEVADVAGCGSTDLYIWDFYPEISLPVRNWTLSKNLFLVHRKDLELFRKITNSAEVHILLKPVMRTTLAAFLGFAISTDSSSSLRAERDQILQCLIQTNLRLQEYDHDRTNFLARAVHDFHAPLTALGGYCGLLLSEMLGPLHENQREVLTRMNHSVKRLSRMASAMFQLSVGRQVKRQPELRPGDIRECLDQAMHEIAVFADEKHISITPELEEPDEPLFFDPGQIEQVLVNILDNACKFTPKFGSIEIQGYPFFWERRRSLTPLLSAAVERRYHSSRDFNSYRIDITDSGSPIPREHLERIFEEYTSYSGGRDRSGGGLGLSICRMIITQHDGHVWAENTESGPMFSFVLPMRRPELIPAETNQRNESSIDVIYRGTTAHADN